MLIFEALAVSGGWVEVNVIGIVSAKGKVLAVVTPVSGGDVEAIPLDELRSRRVRLPQETWPYTGTSAAPILDARARSARYVDL